MIRICISISLVMFYGFIFAQNTADFNFFNQGFLKHLTVNKLYDEKLYYLNNLPIDNNLSFRTEIAAEKGWTFHISGLPDSSFHAYSNLTNAEIRQTVFNKDYQRLLFGLKNFEGLDSYKTSFDLSKQDKIDTALALMKFNYDILHLDQLPDYLQSAYFKNRELSKKYVLVSCVASALVPGLGKMYYGQEMQGVNMLILNLIMAGLTTEAYFRSGPQSAQFIVFASMFGVVYTGNILGTVLGLKKLKRDYKNQMHHEIYEHYLADYSRYPY